MKILLLIALLALTVNAAHLSSANDAANIVYEEEGAYESMESTDRMRHRRVTCDLMNYGGKVGHSACTANCLSMGKAGGRCHKGVCQCRKTTFKDFKEKRFG